MQCLSGDETCVLTHQHRYAPCDVIGGGEPPQRRLFDDMFANIFSSGTT